jgi:hypothetical protein
MVNTPARYKMVHYIYVNGRQHGVTMDTAQHQFQLLKETIKRDFSETSQCHGMYYRKIRKQPHPSWLRKEVVYALAGKKGTQLLNEVWYNTCLLIVNLKIEGDLDEGRL